MKIPDIVKKTAYEQGFNDDIYFVGIIDGAELYSVGKLAENGTPLITGLPSYILLKDDSVTIVSGLEGLDLAYRLMDLDR